MAKFEHKNGSGSIFKNDRKYSDKHPDYTGTMRGLDGIEYRVALWVKEGKKGKFFSLSQSEITTPNTTKEEPNFDPLS